MIRLLAIGLTYCVVSNAAYSDYDWGAMSGRLSPNATEQQVMSVVGYRPNKVELQTCGADAPRAVQRSIHDAHGEDCTDAAESDAMPSI